MNDLTRITSEATHRQLISGARFTVRDIAQTLFDDHPDILAAHGAELARKAVEHRITRLLRGATVETLEQAINQGELHLPGMAPPLAIAVPTPGGDFCYVPFADATWADLQAAKEARVNNVRRSQARLRDLDAKMDTLRPYMERFPRTTVRDAARLLNNQKAAA